MLALICVVCTSLILTIHGDLPSKPDKRRQTRRQDEPLFSSNRAPQPNPRRNNTTSSTAGTSSTAASGTGTATPGVSIWRRGMRRASPGWTSGGDSGLGQYLDVEEPPVWGAGIHSRRGRANRSRGARSVEFEDLEVFPDQVLTADPPAPDPDPSSSLDGSFRLFSDSSVSSNREISGGLETREGTGGTLVDKPRSGTNTSDISANSSTSNLLDCNPRQCRLNLVSQYDTLAPPRLADRSYCFAPEADI